MAFTGLNFKVPKKIRKSTMEPHICFRKETALENNLCSKNYRSLLKMVKIFPSHRFAKATITRKKRTKMDSSRHESAKKQKRKNDSRTTLEFQEWQDFEKWQKWPSCKGHRGKIVKNDLFCDCILKLKPHYSCFLLFALMRCNSQSSHTRQNVSLQSRSPSYPVSVTR